jgi:hypothetical protein
MGLRSAFPHGNVLPAKVSCRSVSSLNSRAPPEFPDEPKVFSHGRGKELKIGDNRVVLLRDEA